MPVPVPVTAGLLMSSVRRVARRGLMERDRERERDRLEAEGFTENRARSWASVSRIREVMSCGSSKAFVKALGRGKLVAVG